MEKSVLRFPKKIKRVAIGIEHEEGFRRPCHLHALELV
jgi:hypothetical protein